MSEPGFAIRAEDQPAWAEIVRRAERGESVAVIAHGDHVADIVPSGELDRLRETEVRNAMSSPEAYVPASDGTTLERSREAVLEAARPLPPDEDVVIEELSDDEDRRFLAVVLDS